MKTTRIWTGMATVMVVPALAAIAVAGGERGGVAASGGGPELEVDINDPACNAAGPVFCEIQQAIDAAVAGAEIEVKDGVYMPINIPAGLDNLTIEADDDDDPIIDALQGLNAVTVNADGFEISGFEIRNAFDNGVIVLGNNAEIEDCEIHNCGNSGIGVSGMNCEIEDNEIFNCGFNPIGIAGAGILLLTSNGHEVEGNEVRDNPAATAVGILLADADNCEVCDNECENNGIDGISLLDSDNNEVEGNDCENNGFDGIFLDPTSDNNEVEENSAEENAVTGCRDQGTGNAWEENESCENMVDGFNISSTMSTYCDNESEDNGFDGFFAPAGMMNTIEDNEAEDNGCFGINDLTVGGGTQGTANMYDDNDCDDNGAGDSSPAGLCD